MLKQLMILLLSMAASLSYAAAPQINKLTVILDDSLNPHHAPLVIAQQQGFFKEQGLEVKLINPKNPEDALKLVATKQADVGLAHQPQFMQQVDQGLPLIRIGTLIDKPLNCVVALKSSGIQSLADLKNKRIGATSGELSNAFLQAMLAGHGVANKDVSIVPMVKDSTQALLTHQVDALSGMTRNFGVAQLELAGKETVIFFPEEHGIPNYAALIFISHLSKIQDERLAHFLAAIKKAIAYLDAHPQQSWQQFIIKYPQANNSLNHETWFATIPYFAEDPANFRQSHWQNFALFMQQHGLIKNVQPISRYAVILPRTTEFAPEL